MAKRNQKFRLYICRRPVPPWPWRHWRRNEVRQGCMMYRVSRVTCRLWAAVFLPHRRFVFFSMDSATWTCTACGGQLSPKLEITIDPESLCSMALVKHFHSYIICMVLRERHVHPVIVGNSKGSFLEHLHNHHHGFLSSRTRAVLSIAAYTRVLFLTFLSRNGWIN